MHNMVAKVFKVIGFMVILIFLLDIGFNVYDRLTAYNRIQTIGRTISEEATKHNAIPNTIRDLFETQLTTVADRSFAVKRVDWNIDHAMTVAGYTAPVPAINEANVRNYGEEVVIVIRVTYQLQSLFFSQPSVDGDSMLEYSVLPENTVDYVFTVPALRVLK